MSNPIVLPSAGNPFQGDPRLRERIAGLAESVGPAIAERLRDTIGPRRDPQGNAGGVLPAAEAAAIVRSFGLAGIEELMLLGLGAAETLARPSVSDFFVGTVGLEHDTQDLIFGGNLEFPGTHLGTTIHGEGFVAARAFSRGTSLTMIALREAHPCGHCRQFLSEFRWAGELTLIDPLGYRLGLAQLYPWPFDPHALGTPGAQPGTDNWPDLRLPRNDLDPTIASRLAAAGRRAWAPYSKCPGAIVLTMTDGSMVAGASIESVAFNPTISPVQAALVDLAGHGYDVSQIATAVLGTRRDGAVDHTRSTSELLSRVAPHAELVVLEWENHGDDQ